MLPLNYSQNYLNNLELLVKLVSKADFSETDVVYDIGAGKGAITDALKGACARVIAVELDRSLADGLISRFKDGGNVSVVNADFMEIDLPPTNYKVFSNIPFNRTSEIFHKLYFSSNPPAEAYLILQKEAAERFLGIGEGSMTFLLLAPFFNMEIVHKFSKADFTPVPSVDTVLLRIDKRVTPRIDFTQEENYRDFIVYVLKQQKPTLRLRTTKLFTSEQFKRVARELGLPETVVASSVGYSQWIELFDRYLRFVQQEKRKLTLGVFNSHKSTLFGREAVYRTKVRL